MESVQATQRATVPMVPQPRYTPFQIHGDRPDRWWNENRAYPRRGPMMSKEWRAPFKVGDRIPEGVVQSCVPEQADGVWRWAIEAT